MADTKTLDMTAASALDGTELYYGVQGSADRKVTGAQIKTLVQGSKLSDFAVTTSAELAGVISNETGSSLLVFNTSPTLVTPLLGTPTSGTLTNCTGLPAAGVVGTAAVLTANTFTGLQTFTGNIVISGSQSAAAWTTTGISLVQAAASYTDTSSSGTVATMYINRLGAATVLASSATTYTNSYGLWIDLPIASTNVTMTNRYAAGFGGSINVNGGIYSATGLNNTALIANTAGQFYMQPDGTARAGFNFSASNFEFSTGVAISWNSGSALNGSRDTWIRRVSAASFALGDNNAASPVAQTIGVQGTRSGTDSNIGGANWTINPSIGTGTGTPANIIINGIVGATTGTGTQTTVAALTIAGVLNGQLPSVRIGSAAIATNATDGFLYIPTCAGTPTGTPTATTGLIPMIYDTTNHQFWFYDAGWKQPKTPAGAALVTWQ